MLALYVGVLLITAVVWIPLVIFAALFLALKTRDVYMLLVTKPGIWFTAEEIQSELQISRMTLKPCLRVLGTEPKDILRRVRAEYLDSLDDELLKELEDMEGRAWFMAKHDKLELFEFSVVRRGGGKKRKRKFFLSLPEVVPAPQRA